MYALEGFINTLDLNPFALSLVLSSYVCLYILLQLHNPSEPPEKSNRFQPPPPRFSGIKNMMYYTNAFSGSGIWIGHSGHVSAHGVWRTQRLDAGNMCRLFHSRVYQLMLIKDAWRVSSCLCGPPHMVSLSFSKELSSFLQDLLMLSYFIYSIFFVPFYFSVCLLWINCVLITPFRKVSSSYLKVTCCIYFLMEVILNFFSYT